MLATEQQIHRCGSRHERGEVNLLQAEIAAELLKQAGPLVQPSMEIASDMLPPVRFFLVPRRRKSACHVAGQRSATKFAISGFPTGISGMALMTL